MWMLVHSNRADEVFPAVESTEEALEAAARVDPLVRSHLERMVLDARTSLDTRTRPSPRF